MNWGDNKPLRVLRIYHSAVVDEYRQRERLLRERHGHDVHVICPPVWPEGGFPARPSLDSSVPVHVVKSHGRPRPNLFWYSPTDLRRVMRELRPHIIDLHEEPFSLVAATVLGALAREAPDSKLCVYTAQNLPKRYPPPFSIIEQLVLRRAQAAYPCSTEASARLFARGFRGDVTVLPLGVTIPDGRPHSMHTGRVGFVSRLEPYKGGMIAVRAFAAAATADPSSQLEIVGAGSEGRAMREEVERLGLTARVSFLGAVSQNEALERMSTYDIVLVPSLTTRKWKEQFGRVPAQAMAHGAAVIASDSGSLREVVDNCGVLVPEGDVDAFGAALRDLLQRPERTSLLREMGRRRAAERFSWEAISSGINQMYGRLMAA